MKLYKEYKDFKNAKDYHRYIISLWKDEEYMMIQWLLHRCLYYKHNAAKLLDTQFDHFEEKVLLLLGDQDMVDWDPGFSDLATEIDSMSLEDVRKIADYH